MNTNIYSSCVCVCFLGWGFKWIKFRFRQSSLCGKVYRGIKGYKVCQQIKENEGMLLERNDSGPQDISLRIQYAMCQNSVKHNVRGRISSPICHNTERSSARLQCFCWRKLFPEYFHYCVCGCPGRGGTHQARQSVLTHRAAQRSQMNHIAHLRSLYLQVTYRRCRLASHDQVELCVFLNYIYLHAFTFYTRFQYHSDIISSFKVGSERSFISYKQRHETWLITVRE